MPARARLHSPPREPHDRPPRLQPPPRPRATLRRLARDARALGAASALAQASRSRSASSTSARATTSATTRRRPQAAAEIKKMPGVKVVEEENVPETADVQKTMTGMIEQDGATLLFPTSFGYFDPHMLAMAREVSRRALRALRRHVDRRQAPEEHRQLLRLHRRVPVPERRDRRPHDARARSSASSPPSRSRRCCATSTPSRWARARSTRRSPRTVIFTGDWSMPVKEAEATNSLVDQGVDVFTMHVDGPKVIVETAAKRGKMVCGYHASQAKLAPQRLPHRRRVELAHRLQDRHRRGAGRQAASELPARRPEGRLRQDVALRPDGAPTRRRRTPTTSRPR